MPEGSEKKPLELNYARPEERRSFQAALTEFVKQETANDSWPTVLRPKMLLQAALMLGAIAGLFIAVSWCAYRLGR